MNGTPVSRAFLHKTNPPALGGLLPGKRKGQKKATFSSKKQLFLQKSNFFFKKACKQKKTNKVEPTLT